MSSVLVVGPILEIADKLHDPSRINILRCKERLPAIVSAVRDLPDPRIVIVRAELFDRYSEAEIWDVVRSKKLLLIVVRASAADYGVPFILKGCAGLLDPAVTLSQLTDVLYRVAAGEICAPAMVLSQALRYVLHTEAQSPLTAREQQVYELVSRGLTNRQVAQQLCVSRETVRWHLRGITRKLGKSIIQDFRQRNTSVVED